MGAMQGQAVESAQQYRALEQNKAYRDNAPRPAGPFSMEGERFEVELKRLEGILDRLRVASDRQREYLEGIAGSWAEEEPSTAEYRNTRDVNQVQPPPSQHHLGKLERLVTSLSLFADRLGAQADLEERLVRRGASL